jgi:hypothetical protein
MMDLMASFTYTNHQERKSDRQVEEISYIKGQSWLANQLLLKLYDEVWDIWHSKPQMHLAILGKCKCVLPLWSQPHQHTQGVIAIALGAAQWG